MIKQLNLQELKQISGGASLTPEALYDWATKNGYDIPKSRLDTFEGRSGLWNEILFSHKKDYFFSDS